VQNATDKGPALAAWKARVAENLPACSRLGLMSILGHSRRAGMAAIAHIAGLCCQVGML
jgi:hypothetical protein